MKNIKIVLAIALGLGVLLFLGTCVTTKTPLPTDNIDELLGAWINPEYEGPYEGFQLAKYIYKEDMTATMHEYLEGGSRAFVIYIDVKEKWVDHRGAVYFIDFIEHNGGAAKTHRLLKISSDRKTLEVLTQSDINLLPSKMNPDAPYCNYYIMYRQ